MGFNSISKKFFSKIVSASLVAAILGFCTANSFAQLSGNYTINPAGGGDYTDFASAVNDLQTVGVSAAVVFNVVPGVYSEILGGTNGIPAISGADVTNTITFKNDGSGGNVVLSPVLTGVPSTCVFLNGGSFLVFDAIDADPDLASTDGKYGYTITGGSSYNTIMNCDIQSYTSSSSTFKAVNQIQSGGITNNYNSYHNNKVHNSYYGFYLNGSSQSYDSSNFIYDNEITDVTQYAIYYYYQKPAKIYGNDIHDIGVNSLTYGINILVSDPSSTIEIYNNKIHGIMGSSGRGIQFGGSTSKKLIYNNMLYDFQTTGQNLAVFAAGASNGDEYYNNTIYINETGTTQQAYGFFNNSAQNVIFRNNIVMIEKAQGETICFNKPNGTIQEASNNCYLYSSGNNNAFVGKLGSTNYKTLSDWQAATSLEANSVFTNPNFLGINDAHIDPTKFSKIEEGAIPIAAITTDIDGDTRDPNSPDIGADEFLGVFAPGTLAADPAPGTLNIFWGLPGENGTEIKFDDGSSEYTSGIPNAPQGLNTQGPGSFATIFDIVAQTQITGPAQLNSIKIFIVDNAIATAQFNVNVFGFDAVSGEPGNLIQTFGPFDQSGASGDFINIDANGLGIGSSKFAIGVQQISSDKISLGGDETLAPPFTFNNNTHFLAGTGTGWLPIETLAPLYGQIIPMIRCFVEPAVSPAPIVKKTINQIATPPIVEFKLFKLNGQGVDAMDVITNGSAVYNGSNQFYTDGAVINPNLYSYAVTIVYDINGTNVESEPGNMLVSSPLPGGPMLAADSVNFGVIQQSTPSFANLKVKNVGDGILNVTNLIASPPFAVSINSPATPPFDVSSGDSAMVEISVFLTTQGIVTGTIQIISNSPTNPDTVGVVAEVPVAINESKNSIPNRFELSQNYPNPFNPLTKIEFGIPEKSFTKVVVYNALGQEVRTLVNEVLAPAFYVFDWSGKDNSGKSVASGIYFVKLEAGDFAQTRKMIFLK